MDITLIVLILLIITILGSCKLPSILYNIRIGKKYRNQGHLLDYCPVCSHPVPPIGRRIFECFPSWICKHYYLITIECPRCGKWSQDVIRKYENT